MPVEAEDSRAQRFLEVFRNPPVRFGVVLADRDRAGTGCNRELFLIRGPADERCGAVDTQQHERRLPNGCAGVCVALERPNVGIAIVRAGDDPVRLRSPVDRCDELVVLHGEPR